MVSWYCVIATQNSFKHFLNRHYFHAGVMIVRLVSRLCVEATCKTKTNKQTNKQKNLKERKEKKV